MFTLVYTVLACAPMVLAVVATLCTMAYMWAASKPIEYHTHEPNQGVSEPTYAHPYRGSHPTPVVWEYRPVGRGQYRRVRVTRCEARSVPVPGEARSVPGLARGPPTPPTCRVGCVLNDSGDFDGPPPPGR